MRVEPVSRSPGEPSLRRVVFHVDMDAFFASVEQLFNPRLRGRPVMVCGSTQGRGVVATASYEARPFGVRCGMPVAEARRLCPHGEFVEGDPTKYIHLSLEVLDILRSASPTVEPFSIDEAFLELTGQVRGRPGMLALASRIQRRIRDELRLTASVGIGPNKFVAKMASGVHKPEGLTCFSEADFRRHFGPQPVQELWGVGEATAKAMNALGILTVNQLAAAPREILSATFGVVGPGLKLVARGEDDSPVVPYDQSPDAKSIGHEHTLARDEADPERLHAHLLRLSDQVARRARAQGFAGRVVSVKVRQGDFTTRQGQQRLGSWVSGGLEIYRAAAALFRRLQEAEVNTATEARDVSSLASRRHRGVRLLGVSLSELTRMSPDPQQLLFPVERRSRIMIEAVDALRDRLGEDVLVRAGAMICRD
ncbi:MAG: DNA polymerase IV [Candidatus Eisenbacteria bacterium]|nr:DNA polymerase IV [Candidatus Eisenbacteria bacterium]